MTDFVEILQIRLEHDFYSSGRTGDFEIVPLDDTSRTLRGHRLLFRQDGSVGRVFAEANKRRPLIDLSSVRALDFGLILNNRKFEAFTDEPVAVAADRARVKAGQQVNRLWMPAKAHIALIEGAGDSLVEQAVFCFWGSVPVQIMTDEPGTEIRVEVKTPGGIAVREQVYVAQGESAQEDPSKGRVDDHIDVGDLAPGLYQLAANVADQPTIDILLRPDLRNDFYRTMHLRFADRDFVDDGGTLSDTRVRRTVFRPAQKVWSYHISAGPKKAGVQFEIRHAVAAGADRIEFGDAVAQPGNGGRSDFIIQSTAPVADREQPRSKIQLFEKPAETAAPDPSPEPSPDPSPVPAPSPAPAAGPAVVASDEPEPLIANLPSPSPGSPTGEVFIHV